MSSGRSSGHREVACAAGARPGRLRLFAFAVPTILYLLNFLAVQHTYSIWWSIHLWLGSAVLAGVTGWLLSYLVAPPALPPAA